MRNSRVKIFSSSIAGLTIFLAGCATMPTMDKPMEKTRTFSASYGEVWSSAITALTTSNQMITLSEKDSGVIGVDRQFNQQQIWDYVLIDGWSKFWTTWTNFQSRANFVIQALGPTETKVTVNTQIRADTKQYDYNIWWGTTSTSNVQRGLSSNGKLEKEYLDMIEAQLPNIRQLKWLDTGQAAPSKNTLPVPTAIASPTVKAPLQTGRTLVGGRVNKSLDDLEAEKRRLAREQAKMAYQMKILERKAQFEEERKKLAAERVKSKSGVRP